MEQLLILILLVVVVFWWTKRKSRATDHRREPAASNATPAISITMSTKASAGPDVPKTGAVTATDGGWILNPKSTFPLTVTGIGQAEASQLKELLNTVFSAGLHGATRAMTPFVAQHNVRCKEIDEYVGKFKTEYLKTIEDQQSRSPEWPSASPRDREDLMAGFRRNAVQSLDVRPDCEVEILFEGEPSDATVDDALLARYGYEPLQLYLRHADRLEKVRAVPADHYDRGIYEKLVSFGLARQATQVPRPAILDTLKLKELNELVADPNVKPFSRKPKAIEFLTTLADLDARLGEKVAFRELFQLLPLPSEFSSIDLQQVAGSWRYAREISYLMAHTCMMATYATRDRSTGFADVAGWEILGDDRSCPYCVRASAKKYSKGRAPKVPLHISCRCSLTANYSDT